LDRNKLVSALPDLTSHLLEADVIAELDHGFMPGDRVQVHGIQQGTIQVEDSGFRQLKLSFYCSTSLAHQEA
jgi:hypothetical protein